MQTLTLDCVRPLIHRELPASASCTLRLKVCTTEPGWDILNDREVIKELKKEGFDLSATGAGRQSCSGCSHNPEASSGDWEERQREVRKGVDSEGPDAALGQISCSIRRQMGPSYQLTEYRGPCRMSLWSCSQQSPGCMWTVQTKPMTHRDVRARWSRRHAQN